MQIWIPKADGDFWPREITPEQIQKLNEAFGSLLISKDDSVKHIGVYPFDVNGEVIQVNVTELVLQEWAAHPEAKFVVFPVHNHYQPWTFIR
jgi:hypothetical protein